LQCDFFTRYMARETRADYKPAERVGGAPKDPPETAEVTRLNDTSSRVINQAPWYIKQRVKTVTELAPCDLFISAKFIFSGQGASNPRADR
jgi:hypothetical protein